MIEIENWASGSDSPLNLYKHVENYRLLSEMRQGQKIAFPENHQKIEVFLH